MMIKVGDIVVRKSYGGDLYFRVNDINWYGDIDLVGIDYRIKADAPLNDLILVDNTSLTRQRKESLSAIDKKIEKILNDRKDVKQTEEEKEMNKPVKVLHLDGDEQYLNICIKYYKELGIEAYGELLQEAEQPEKVSALLNKYNPDILVITGHDSITKKDSGYEDINNYRTSKYFVEAVKRAREYEPNMDQLIIFAGACQSYYEAILKAGANFASSPERILIHALDPVLISEKVAYTPINSVLKVKKALENTFTGKKGLGGYDTKGKYREGTPKGKYK